MSIEIFSVWEGVYSSFEATQGDVDAFDMDVWINKQKQHVLKSFASLSVGKMIPENAISKEYPLSMLAALLMENSSLSILDFGGGMGGTYLELLSKIPNAKDNIQYSIVESPVTIAAVPVEIKKIHNLKFYEKLDDVRQTYDIVHIGSALQYISDWQGLISQLITKFSPRYLVFSDLMAGDVPEFVSIQKFYGKNIPTWFFNQAQFENIVEAHKYHKIYQSHFIRNILNQEEIFPNHALPLEYRIKRGINLVFKKHE